MWVYQQSTGKLYSPTGVVLASGYSGHAAGRNNPDLQNVPMIGPIPRGKYSIGAHYDDQHLGPVVMHLDAEQGTNTFGRSLFRMHGDNVQHDASEGCIIMPRDVRESVAASADRELSVIR